VAAQNLVDLHGLFFERFVPNNLQQLTAFCQTASQARLGRGTFVLSPWRLYPVTEMGPVTLTLR
jgi:hypothetical protein